MSWVLFATALTVPPAAASHAQARVMLRIVSSAQVSAATWAQSRRRTERVVRERDGRLILLRTVDFE